MTPEIIDTNIKRLINKLNASHEPIYLDVEPELDADVRNCFLIVREKVKKSGGKMILGWQIWKTKHMVEAECHAVWEDLSGELHDITPKEFNIIKILFVEDENMIYEDKQIDNIRMNITKNPLVDDLINVSKAIYRFENKDERALLYDLTNVLNGRQKQHRLYLVKLKDFINFILMHNGNRKSLCPCNSRIKFKECHGKDMDSRISRDI